MNRSQRSFGHSATVVRWISFLGVGVFSLLASACVSTRETRVFLPPPSVTLDDSRDSSSHGQDPQQETSAQQLDQLEDLKKRLSKLERQLGKAEESEQTDDGIHVGGAVRFNYSLEDFNDDNPDRGGDFDLDTIRIEFDGSISDVILSAELRYYQYMEVVHHAWVGYDFSEAVQFQAGIHLVPFGNQRYNSQNYFFSSNYYVGIEDDYDAGLKLLYDDSRWNAQFAFYLNDELGGIDGYVSDRSDRYSYDVVGVREPGEGTFDEPSNEIAENNTFNVRLAYALTEKENARIEVGVSAQAGGLEGGGGDAGDNHAYALHAEGQFDRWLLQLQASTYEYTGVNSDLVVVGAYSFFDTIPAEADTYTANVAYTLPVKFGPVTSLQFYDNLSLITGKSANLDDTWMNVLGVGISAGPLYIYVDYVVAENQPFIGGSIGSDSDAVNHRFNINVGYYF